MENKYKNGEVVFERIRPTQKLVIRGYFNGIYYCKCLEARTRKELVYFERELLSDSRV
jgi:hypothetical protein